MIKSNRFKVFASVSLIALTTGGMAFAQETEEAAAENRTKLDTIVVTGTLIRGADAVGSKTVQLDEEAIRQTGSSTTNELLGSIPQVANFFNQRYDQDPRGADRLQVSRPNLRNLPGINSATGAVTLVLVDGHRMTPMGVDQASFDPDFVPPGGIQRVDVVTDGGSSLYGADAVGGVINFITIDEYDGVKVDVGVETGDAFSAWNAGLTAGTAWDTGSVFASLATYQRDELLTKERDWAAQGQWNEDGTVLSPAGTECIVPVGELQTWFFFGAGWTDNPAAPGVTTTPIGEPCDTDAEGALLPELERNSVLVGFTQELSDTITLDVKANFGQAETTYSAYPLGDTISEASPNDQGIVGNFVGEIFETAAVGFSYGAHPAYVDRKQTLKLQNLSITPELTFEISDTWELNTLLHIGRSESERTRPVSNRTALLAAVDAGTVDPTDIASADASVIAEILDFEAAGEANQELLILRAIGNGELFDLPAGTVRAAIGMEYNQDSAELREGSYAIGGLGQQPFADETRDVISAFGELSVPVTSILNLSLSGRYDDYSDFGDTFNPNIGLDLKPIEGLRIYGKWGEAFNAPTVLDSLGTSNARFIANAAPGVPDPNGELTGRTNDDVLLVEGTGGGLEPQTATTIAGGFDYETPNNIRFGVGYYDIEFENLLGSVNPQLASVVLLNPDKFVFNPTQAEFDAFLAASDNGEQFANIDAADVGVIIDRRVSNIGEAHLTGFDFYANYTHETDIGDFVLVVTGNKQQTFDITENGNTVDQLEFDLPDLTVAGNIGWNEGGKQAKLTVKYTSGFDSNVAVNQTSVDSFVVTDLFLGYTFDGPGAAEGVSLRLNVDNLFDQDPPEYRQQRNLNYSGWTLGRIFKISASKEF